MQIHLHDHFTYSKLLSVPLARMFASYDPELYALTLKGFRIYAVSFMFSGMAVLGSSFFTALNNGLVSAFLSFMRTIVFQVVCVLCFPLIFGIDGIWFSGSSDCSYMSYYIQKKV